MAFEASQCGALCYKTAAGGILTIYTSCDQPHVDGKTCAAHTGFYESDRWLDALFRERGGMPAQIGSSEWKHMRSALRNGRVVLTPETVRPVAARIRGVVSSPHFIGGQLALFLYETHDISSRWSATLWQQALRALPYTVRQSEAGQYLDIMRGVPSEEPYVDRDTVMRRLFRESDDLAALLNDDYTYYVLPTVQEARLLQDIVEQHPEWIWRDDIRAGLLQRDPSMVAQVDAALAARERALATACVAAIREELMATTWHPERFIDWCVDMGERSEWVA